MTRTILVVDDEADVRDFVATLLESSGYVALTARDGAEALESLAAHQPDAVVLDVTMPEVDGWTVLEHMKSRSPATIAEIPVVMLTALGSTADRLRGGIDGALHYLTKPFEIDELLAVLDSVCAPDAPPEPARRLDVQQRALAQVAAIERGGSSAPSAGHRVHLTRLEATVSVAPPPPRRGVEARKRLSLLSASQLHLIEVLATTASVTDAAERLKVSRSNIYASLRRICRRLDLRGAPELLDLLRSGDLLS